jgi:small conductance mechanosensitive channel
MFNLADLKNLFHDFLLTAAARGPKILIILFLCWVAIRFVKLLTAQVMKLMRGASAGPGDEREQRMKTLSAIVSSALKVAIYIVGILMILPELGINIGPILAGVGVLGLAIGFGAQNLVRDIVTGFFIILENQYAVGDVIQIGGVSGVVEDISIRVTVLRDVQGVVHYVPNGQITVVDNMTKIWSRALVEIDVAYGENVDRVMEVIRETCEEIRRDPQWAGILLDDFEIPGIERLDASSVAIRVMVKTKPLEQWNMMREMRKRFKNKFDEAGIEIPFPQHSVWMRSPQQQAETGK